jgi:hypothetical protein
MAQKLIVGLIIPYVSLNNKLNTPKPNTITELNSGQFWV